MQLVCCARTGCVTAAGLLAWVLARNGGSDRVSLSQGHATEPSLMTRLYLPAMCLWAGLGSAVPAADEMVTAPCLTRRLQMQSADGWVDPPQGVLELSLCIVIKTQHPKEHAAPARQAPTKV